MNYVGDKDVLMQLIAETSDINQEPKNNPDLVQTGVLKDSVAVDIENKGAILL